VTGFLHVVLPNDIDDPATPSGGNVYDRRICDGLGAYGWSVLEYPVRGTWPRPGPTHREGLARVMAALPDHAVILIDGLIASAVPEILTPHARRLALVVLVHAPLGERAGRARDREREALACAGALVTTSRWSARRLAELYPSLAGRIHAAPPGVDAAPLASGSPAGNRLLCVAPVSPHKGHDVLVGALAMVRDLPWRCAFVGQLDRDPGFVDQIRRRVHADGIAERISFVGPRVGIELSAHYRAADLLVQATRGETYGMVVTEALARGVPVLASAVDGLPEALGDTPEGIPGLLVPAGDPAAFAGALRRWLTDPQLRTSLRSRARTRRSTLDDWSHTSTRISEILSAAATGAMAGR
jgi:glycosyltransferase involved in cell wall biosynthesis